MNKRLKSLLDFIDNLSKVTIFISAIIFIFIWYFVIANFITKLPSNFSYYADIISTDNFFNLQSNDFETAKFSKTLYSFSVESVDNLILNIRATFNVKSLDGKQIFKTEPLYGINSITQKHQKGYGDIERQGYLFAPKFLTKNKQFLFWHVSDNKPSLMKYVSSEYINGLKVYKFRKALIEPVDQTNTLSFLPDVPETKGIKLESELEMLIEPISGHVVDIKDYSINYYCYDIKTGEKLTPYNKFLNQFSEESVNNNIEIAKHKKKVNVIMYIIFPLFILMLSFLYIFRKTQNIKEIIELVYRNLLIISIFIFGSIITTLFYIYVNNTVKDKEVQHLTSETNAYISYISEKAEAYNSILLGGRALFNSSDNVNREEWEKYVESIELTKRYPGILGLGFSKVVEPENKIKFEAKIIGEGFENFKIFPEGKRDLYTSIIYLEPLNEKNQMEFGYDMYTESRKKLAMDSAMQSNKISISDKLNLVQKNDTGEQSGFLAYLPVYKNNFVSENISERVNNIFGFVYSPFMAKDFVISSVDYFHNDLDINIYLGISTNPDDLIYSSEELGTIDEQIFYKQVKTIYLFNFPWTIEFYNSSEYERESIDKFLIIFIPWIGLLITILSVLVTYSITNAKKRAVNYADKMNKDLKETLEIIEKNAIGLSKFEMAVDNAYDHIVITDSEGVVIYANNSVKRITGFDKTEIIGKKAGAKELWGGLMDKAFYKKMWNTIKVERKTFSGEVKNKRKNGEEYYAFASISPVLNKDKEIVYFIGIERDITKEKEIDKAKSEFVSLASHQLKTPLSAIKWYSEILLEEEYGKLNDEQKKYIKEIETGNERMIGLINSLLNSSSLELGTFTIESEKINLEELTKTVVNEIIPKYKNKNINIDNNFSNDLTEFKGDRKKLTIVLQNLISNAFKYSRKDSTVEIEIKIIKRGEKFGEKKISQKSFGIKISDTGIGIPENQQEEIFNKMFRAQNAKSIETDGNGLGLYMVKSIAEKSNGSIWFTSKENVGTSFYITYPIAGMKVVDKNKI